MNIPACQFDPWVGDHYCQGYAGGPRLLILGESHYDKNSDTAPSERNFTQRLTHAYMKGCWKHAFWTNIMQVVMGCHYTEITTAQKEAFWQSVALYNYIQVMLERSGRHPPQCAWWASRPAFEAVLEALRPHALLILGVRTWNNLPCATPDSGHTDCQGPALGACELGGHTWQYVLPDGHLVLAAGIRHPAGGFAWEKWHPVVRASMTAPRCSLNLTRRRVSTP